MIDRIFRSLLPLVAAGIVVPSAVAADAASEPAVKLAVVITIDQLRADYLVRFRPWLVAGGFKRLLEGGADFRNAHYRHAQTVTASGHAGILTGVHPDTHGIVGNTWLDRGLWEEVNNVEDRAAPLVGLDPAEAAPTLRGPKGGRSPRALQATTVSDQLKLRFGSGTKIFSASNKDRSAILLGGKLADGAYWDELGMMVTSRYYAAALPAWVAAFNAERLAHGAFGKTWERLLPAAIYDRVQGPDDAPGETVDFGFTRTFPKVVNGGADKVTAKFYSAYDNAPHSAEFLGEFLQRAIREERLGRNAATDMLCFSFSQLDSIGHSYGPDSHEVMDSLLRIDRVLASILDLIDREVGLARCVIVLTADHGVAPMPERVQAIRPEIPAGRVKLAEMDPTVTQALDAAFGPLPTGEYWFTRHNSGYHVRPSALAAKKLAQDAVAKVVKAAVLRHPFIAHAFTREEILAISPEGETLPAMVRRTYYAPADRDVVFVLKPYFIERNTAGSTHGSPYDYDTNVALLWYGRGVKPGVHHERVGIDDIAPTLSTLLDLPIPPQAQGRRLFE